MFASRGVHVVWMGCGFCVWISVAYLVDFVDLVVMVECVDLRFRDCLLFDVYLIVLFVVLGVVLL